MNFRTLYLLLFPFLSACSNELRFDHKEFNQKSDLLCKDNCTEINIDIPFASNYSVVADSINKKVFDEIKDLLYLNEKPIDLMDYKTLTQSFIATFESTKAAFPEATFGWDAKIKGAVIYHTQSIVNIELNYYTFTGGAHGFEGKQSLLFDPKTGKIIPIPNIFQKYEEFTKRVETMFRNKYKIPLKGNINQTGYLFDEEVFQLPKNIFFTSDGLLLYYNQYEAAAYAEGPKTLFLPYNSIQDYLIMK